MPSRRNSGRKCDSNSRTSSQASNDSLRNATPQRSPDPPLTVLKRSSRTPIHALNFSKNRSSTPTTRRSSSTSINDQYAPPAKRSRPSFNIEASLISQNNETVWLESGHTSAAAPSYHNLPPSVKIRRPSDSSEECVKKFCWICCQRRPGQELKPCSDCPRNYHQKCLEDSEVEKTNATWEEGWRCLLCHEVATCDEEDCETNLTKWRASISTSAYEKHILNILIFMVDYLSIQNWAEAFREPPDVSDTRMTVRHPMDLRTLYQQVKEGHCKSLKSFLSEIRWIVLNCISHREEMDSGLLSKAKLLEELCLLEVLLLRACPTCYLNRLDHVSTLPSTLLVFSPISRCDPHIYGRSMMKINPIEAPQSSWFCKVCPVLHPIVWVRYEDGIRWPAKLMAELPNSQLLVSFFGTYVTRKAPPMYVSFHTSLGVYTNASADDSAPGGFGIRRLVNAGDCKKEETFNRALEQLGYYVGRVSQAFPKFKFPPAPPTRFLPFSYQSLAKFYKSLNRWVPVSENHELLSKSQLESLNSTNGQASTLTPGPNGDDADSVQTVKHPFLPSSLSSSLPPRLHSVIDPSSFASPSHPPTTTTCFTITTTTTTTTAPSSHSTEGLVEPILVRLSNNLSASFPSPSTTSVTTSNRLLFMSTMAVSTSSIGRSVQPPPCHKETSQRIDRPHCQVPINTVMSVEHPIMDEAADTPDTETLPASSDSTVSTLALRLSESLGQNDHRSNLVTHFQEARDSFSRSLQSLLDGFFQNLEESVNEAAVFWSHGASAAVSEPDLAHPLRSPISTTDRYTQTSGCVVVSTQFIRRNHLEKTLLKAEVNRLTQELERARLEKEYTRLEIATNHHDNISELRAVWEAETQAIVDGIVEICEQDASKKIQEVKKKQWCTYCGNEAFFYCCWNTVYCNTTCQQLHWPQHMNSCTHPKRQVLPQHQSNQRQMH